MKTVFFGPSSSVVKWAWKDIERCSDIEYCEYPTEIGKIVKKLLTRKGMNMVPFCLKRKIYGKILGYEFLKNINRDEEHLFVFTCQNNMFFGTFFISFVRYLKKLFTKSKYVFYYYDLIKTCMPELVEDVKKEFDIVYTFDIGDAQKYGLSFYLEVCSKNQISNDKETPCDFLYIGTDRGRFKTIYSIFKKLSDCDGSCVFYVDKVLNENLEKILDLENVVCDKDTKSGEIHYKNSKLIFNKYVPYQKTLACIDSCKAMVEITFPGQTAGTMRLPESVIYNKKLITTCQSVLRRDFFNKNNILVIEKADDLTKENIDKFMASPLIATEVDFSPLGLIKDAKNKLYK